MKEELKKLKELREAKEILQADYQQALVEFEEENETLIAQIKTNKEHIVEFEEDIREQALTEYEKTGEKKLVGGVGIKIMTKLNYDPKRAFNWAIEHSLALQLNKKTFEKIAKTQELDIVEFEETPIATIPKEIKLEEISGQDDGYFENPKTFEGEEI